jgi:hypothetical protein
VGWVDRWQKPVRPCLSHGGEVKARFAPKISSFVWVTSPLQSEVVGPYLVRGIWVPNHLPLEGTSHIQNFGPSSVSHGIKPQQ